MIPAIRGLLPRLNRETEIERSDISSIAYIALTRSVGFERTCNGCSSSSLSVRFDKRGFELLLVLYNDGGLAHLIKHLRHV
jgi:hypothetical protein